MIHWALILLNVFSLVLPIIIVIDLAIVTQFIGAAFIATVGKIDKPESFSQRFLVLTTYQLFLIMIFLLAVFFGAKDHFKMFMIHYMSIFGVLMIIQSVLLVRLGKKL
ncbi:MAG: hypothetical protein WC994_03715 [Brumimicrobium sp.]